MTPTDELIQRAEALAEEKPVASLIADTNGIHVRRAPFITRDQETADSWRNEATITPLFSSSGRELVPELVRALKEELARPRGWRCFHCDEVFTDSTAAREHFGTEDVSLPACQIDLAEYRKMEEVHRQHVTETDEATTALFAMRADQAVALRREEELGYDRGLTDGHAECAEFLSSANRRNSETIEALKDAKEKLGLYRALQPNGEYIGGVPLHILMERIDALLSNPDVAQETKE